MQLYEHSVFVEYIFRIVFNFFGFLYALDEVKTQMMQIRLTSKHVKYFLNPPPNLNYTVPCVVEV